LTSTHFLIKQKNLRLPFAVIEGEEHHHLSKVLRIKPGKRIWLIDEQGRSFLAEVREVGKEQTTLAVVERAEKEEMKIELNLAQGLIKSKKLDFLVQKATELGMKSFIPVIARRSVVRIQEKEQRKTVRWQKIAAEAAKQSRRSLVPKVYPPQPFSRFVENRNESRKLLLCQTKGRYLRDIFAEGPGRPQDAGTPSVLILVGPEGGWTEDEEGLALERGFEAVSLGKQVLRAETAALAALAVISHFWNI
jgi:16S rRNA (uracil1498-N3)-methyltransferase